MNSSENRLALRHPDQRRLATSRGHYIDPNGSVEQVQRECESRSGGGQHHPPRVQQGRNGGNSGMSGQRNFLGRREKTYCELSAAGREPVHKRRFRLVELPGQSLPGGGAQLVGIEHHGAGIAIQGLSGEGIEEQKGEHGASLNEGTRNEELAKLPEIPHSSFLIIFRKGRVAWLRAGRLYRTRRPGP